MSGDLRITMVPFVRSLVRCSLTLLPCVFSCVLFVVASAGSSSGQVDSLHVRSQFDGALEVLPAPFIGINADIPHFSYNGVPTIFKAVARGGDGTYFYEWDFNGDGVFDYSNTTTDPYDLSASNAYPDQSGDTLFIARIRVTSGAETESAEYKVFVQVEPHVFLETRVNKAIDGGLWYLHAHQSRGTDGNGAPIGYWNTSYSGINVTVAATGAATEAFESLSNLIGGDPDNPYVETVSRGLNYLLDQMHPWTIDAGTDKNGNGIGLGMYSGGDYWRSMYQTGIGLMAFASSRAPDAHAETGPAEVIGRLYNDIVQDIVEALAWGQNGNGGWRYDPNYSGGSSDNSVSQWPTIGLQTAQWAAEQSDQNWHLEIPDYVFPTLSSWADYIQIDGGGDAGGSGYDRPQSANIARTGALLCEMALVGDDGETSPRVDQAVDYMASHWTTDPAHFPSNSYYAFYAAMKGFRSFGFETIPLGDPSGFDWYWDPDKGYATYLVDRQNADGSWPGGYYISGYLSDSWAVLVLLPLIVLPPVGIAEAWPLEAPPCETITFDHSKSYHTDPDRVIAWYRWDFDDDGEWDVETQDRFLQSTWEYCDDIGCGEEVIHPVVLEVEDDQGLTDRDTQRVTIKINLDNHAPVAIGDPTPSDPSYVVLEGGSVILDASHSYDPDSDNELKCDPDAPDDYIVSWEWDLDNDEANGYEGQGETFWFDVPPEWEVGSTHTVKLKVTDDGSWAGFNGGGSLSGYDSVTITMVGGEPELFLSIEGEAYVHGEPDLYVRDGDVLMKTIDSDAQALILRGLDYAIYSLDALSTLPGGQIVFSTKDSAYVGTGEDNQVFLDPNDLGVVDLATGQVGMFLDGDALFIPDIDAAFVAGEGQVIFSMGREGYAGTGRHRVFLQEEDLGMIDLATGRVEKFLDGGAFWLGSLDAVHMLSSTHVLFSLRKDQYFWWGLYLNHEDVGLLDMTTGEITVFMRGAGGDLPSIDALSQ